MKSTIYISVLVFTMVLGNLLISCNKEKDYSSITYRNYLRYEIDRAGSFLLTVAEGTEEGEYQSGATAAYQSKIAEADAIWENATSSQQDIDLAYENILKAGADFFDLMVPFKSAYESLINYAVFTAGYVSEGTLEGNSKPGSKAILQSVIDNSKNILNRSDLTQKMIDTDWPVLMNAIYLFDNNIIGKANLFVDNPSFEVPGYNTTDFAEVPGWMLFGKVETWAPKIQIYKEGTSVLPMESVPDGEFVARIGSYTQGIYQNLPERIHPGVKYTLNFDAAILENYEDAFLQLYKVVILSRLIVFENEPGDYRFMSVIDESYDTLGINPGGFIEFKRDIDIPASSEHLEKNLAIEFLVRHSFDATKPIWAECYVALDDIKLYRKQN